MDVGLILGEASPLTWDRWRHVVALTERCGFRSLFRSDHFFNGAQKDAIDVYLSFVAAAMESRHIRFGPLVTPVTFREPVNVGRMAQQLDALAEGRFVLGLGVGWFEQEHRIYGIDYPPLKERYDRLDDAIALMRALWYEAPANHDGPYYRLSGADSRPHPPAGRPKLLIGGRGPKRTLRAVARWADEWNAGGMPVDQYRASVEALERHCADVGRDPAEIRRSMLLFTNAAPTNRLRGIVSQRMVDMFAPGTGLTIEELAAGGQGPHLFTGNTAELVDTVGRLGDLGLQEVVFEHFVTELDDVVEWLAQEVVPQLRA
jgi:alkanesulfonate monooxygenase SsuD/methylene tetrahydromethanopterin reductase-like flavin-dependent oxidoreductase (luciferase family)